MEWIKENPKTIIAILIFILALVGLGVLLEGLIRNAIKGHYILPALALGGTITLLGSLLVFTTLVNVIGLSNPNQALGLPEGSVRALLALALLGLFAILVSSVLNLKPELKAYPGLRESDVTALIQHNPDAHAIVQRREGDSEPPTFYVEFSSAPRQDDFAKQMLTLVGTLMTAVISFYFGTTAGRPTTDTSQTPSVSPQVSPDTVKSDTEQVFTIMGNGLAGMTQVEALGPPGAASVPPATFNIINDTRGTCTFKLPTTGKWTLRVRSGTTPPVDVSPQIDVT